MIDYRPISIDEILKIMEIRTLQKERESILEQRNSLTFYVMENDKIIKEVFINFILKRVKIVKKNPTLHFYFKESYEPHK